MKAPLALVAAFLLATLAARGTQPQGVRFTFEVRRSVAPEVFSQGAVGERFVLRLVQELPNTTHTLEPRPVKAGEAVIERFEVYLPPLGGKSGSCLER
jgi:hypothetical protein